MAGPPIPRASIPIIRIARHALQVNMSAPELFAQATTDGAHNDELFLIHMVNFDNDNHKPEKRACRSSAPNRPVREAMLCT